VVKVDTFLLLFNFFSAQFLRKPAFSASVFWGYAGQWKINGQNNGNESFEHPDNLSE
jgi:hypothetical protein